jgi:DNA repair exonuclease SbcCD ATPase subunit
MSKDIILKSLKLKNFKGIKALTIDFSKVTNVFGENATGKTSLFDAFTWLMFDKDSQDRTTFEIKTLDSNNQVLHGLEHEVTGVLSVDGRDATLTKVYKEKWTKKRGETERELTGHETLYYINEVPVKKSEYQEKINSIINEQLFKLISNPLYFSTNMKWQDRRKILLDIIGDITSEGVIGYKGNLRAIEALLVDKDIDTLKKSLSARRKKLNDDIKSIPYRIDELNNSIREMDFEALEFEKLEIISSVKSVEDKILDSSKVNEELLLEKNQFYELKSKLKNMEFRAKEEAQKPLHELKVKLYELNNQASTCKINIRSLESDLSYDEKQAAMLENDLRTLREGYSKINEEVLDIPEESFICPTCKRPLEEHDVESQKVTMQENFNLNKFNKLADINTQGKSKKDRLLRLKENIAKVKEHLESEKLQLKSLEVEIEVYTNKINNFNLALNFESNQEYQDTFKQIQELESKLEQPAATANQVADLRAKKRELEHEIEDLNRQLNYKYMNANTKARMEQLLEEEKKLAQQIAELEGQEFLCEEFIKTKVELLEGSINSKFKYVSFKLFDTQVNGGLVETCEALINGVPFSNANTASQINAGLDIITALSEYYGVQAPIFIDNRESINHILDTGSQIINLIVSKDKNLRVEGI